MESKKNISRGSFSGHLGYILATAGSAVGLGNIWRFPYLAAKYGGGIFIVVYIILAVTFGYTMMISETSIGRITGKSPIGAFKSTVKHKISSAGGWINALIPMLILPYYSVIGGWVAKFLYEFIAGNITQTATDGFFGNFIGSAFSSEFWFVVFALATMLVIILGVSNGVERVSKIMMPALVVLSIIMAVYSMTRPGAAAGIKYLFVPDFKNFSWMTVVAALGQMFYSLSIAMGILITYGSYMKKDVNMEKSIFSVIMFDSGIAILAGMMIIPAVFAFSSGNPEALQAGPSLMFITMPKIFASMGAGQIIGILFFVLVLFAALTSSISLAETCTSTIQDELGFGRTVSAGIVTVIVLVLGTLSSFGFNLLSSVSILKMSILDFFDFLTNSVMMPITAICICALIVFSLGFDKIVSEVKLSSRFRLEKMYKICIRYIAPIFILVILASSVLSVFGVIKI